VEVKSAWRRKGHPITPHDIPRGTLKFMTVSRWNETYYIQYNEGKLTGFIIIWVGTAFQNGF
jgi:hypothetical protein